MVRNTWLEKPKNISTIEFESGYSCTIAEDYYGETVIPSQARLALRATHDSLGMLIVDMPPLPWLRSTDGKFPLPETIGNVGA